MQEMQRSTDNLKKLIVAALIALPIIIIDYITKWIIVEKLSLYAHIDVLPFLRIVHVQNEGAAFGLFSWLGNRIFIGISICAILFILIYLWRIAAGLELYAMSLIFAGAIGNLVDRISTGKVIDFIDVFVKDWHWPAFNVADSSLTVGIIIFIWTNVFRGKSQSN